MFWASPGPTGPMLVTGAFRAFRWIVTETSAAVTIGCLIFFNDTATTEIYTLSLHDALPISFAGISAGNSSTCAVTTAGAVYCWRSEEHTSELQSRGGISYAVFCLQKKKVHVLADTIWDRGDDELRRREIGGA